MKQPITSLPKDARFLGFDSTTRYRVTTPAAEHPLGWVYVWNESMTDTEVADATRRSHRAHGHDPRGGVFVRPVLVEVLP
ncbi:hypothetical protein [Actinoplanes rectilineatus]|uniref:hypothetical protein n=1 Tax=Actinoplanes rectilineatus TaxID=113571 RepID=UPI0005F2C144|nr:hypothetical protein [Actinoplanes rectilineatus]